MSKKSMLAALLAFIAVFAAGCSGPVGTESPEPTAVSGVDIIMPYATSTVAPKTTLYEEAL